MQPIPYSFVCDEYPSSICELAGLDLFPAAGHPSRWTDAELAHIRTVLRRLTAQRICNPDDAEDVVQETLLTMVRKAPAMNIEKGMLIWAMGILRKKVGNYYRRVRRITSFDGQVRYALRESRTQSPEADLHHAEICLIVDAILRKLPPQERAAIDLYLAGKPAGEIASLLQPERYQNIINRLHRGRKKLARELSRHGYARTILEKRRRFREI